MEKAMADGSHAERVATFLDHACPDWRMGGGPYQAMHRHTAERILRRYPEIQMTRVMA
jgi:hypothetical protein